MRRMLLLASAIAALALIAVVFIVTSSVARRTAVTRGPAAVYASPPSTAPVATPAPRVRPAPVPNLVSEVLAEAATPRPSGLGSAAMIVTVDPETGRPGLPGPTLQRALTLDELRALARVEVEGLVTVRNADGAETLNHEGRFADHSIARVGPDGTVSYGCVHGEGELAHAMRIPAPAKPAAEDQ